MITPISGKVALVTGGGRGIGRGMALALAKYGAKVAVTARSTNEIESVADEIKALGGEALAIAGDVSNFADVQRIVSTTTKTFGAINILINNAAIIGGVNKIEDTDPAQWLLTQQVNVMGAYYTIRETLASMKSKGYGRIINVSSGAANGLPTASAYSTSKGGMDSLTKVVAAETRGTGVCIVSINPGMVETAMQVEVRKVPKGQIDDNVHKMFHNAKENNSLGDPEQVGEQLVAIAMTDKSGEILSIGELHNEVSQILSQVKPVR